MFGCCDLNKIAENPGSGITKVTAKVIQRHHLHIVAGGPTWNLHIARLTCCWPHPAARKLKGTGLGSALRLCASGKVYTIGCPTFKCPLLETTSCICSSSSPQPPFSHPLSSPSLVSVLPVLCLHSHPHLESLLPSITLPHFTSAPAPC